MNPKKLHLLIELKIIVHIMKTEEDIINFANKLSNSC